MHKTTRKRMDLKRVRSLAAAHSTEQLADLIAMAYKSREHDIPNSHEDQEHVDELDALAKAMIVRRHLDSGHTLRESIRFLGQQMRRAVGVDPRPDPT